MVAGIPREAGMVSIVVGVHAAVARLRMNKMTNFSMDKPAVCRW
jgi:hypothetical protein